MKNLLSLLAVSIFLFNISCNQNTNNSSKEQEDKTIVINDTVLFKYVLGEDKYKSDLRTDSLIKNNIIKDKAESIFTMTRLGHSAKYKVEGYNCKIYIENEELNAIMSLEFYKDKLVRQQFYLYNNSPILELIKIYGKPENNLPIDYPGEAKNDVTAFWKVGNKAIYIARFGTPINLYFEYMPLKIEQSSEMQKEEDSKRFEKQRSNQDKAKDMGW